MRFTRVTVARAGCAIFLFVSGMVASTSPTVHRFASTMWPSSNAADAVRYASPDQLFMILFVESNCQYSNDPAFPALLERVKVGLAAQAARAGLGYASLAVSLDWEPETGLEFLRRFGDFDQVSSGYGWTNSAAIDFTGVPAITSVPQILVLRRTLQGVDDVTASVLSVRNSELIVRKLGIQEIEEWVEQGVTIPKRPIKPGREVEAQ